MANSQVASLIQLFYEPKLAFTGLKEKSTSWIVLGVIISVMLLVHYWYFSTVDFAWLVDHTFSSQADIKPEAREAIAKFMTRDRMMYWSLAMILIAPLVMNAVIALYYFVASKVMGSSISYGKWFHFAVWVGVPILLSTPLMALQVATSHGQVGMEDLNMLSLNYLFVHAPLGTPWASLLNNLSLYHFWTVFLSYVGLRVWTERSSTSCAIAAALPYVFVFGGWALKTAIST